MNNSDERIQQGNYSRAQAETDASIASLSILLNLFMPIPEQIKRLWEAEKDITSQTDALFGDMDGGVKTETVNTGALVTLQRENIRKTQKTVDSITEHLHQAKNPQLQSHQDLDQSSQKGIQSQVGLLKQVEDLLRQAKTHQEKAADYLAKHEKKPAIQAELMAVNKLKGALDAFQQDQQQKQQDKQDEQKKDPQSGKNPNNQSQNRNQNSAGQQNQHPSQSKARSDATRAPEKKLTPKEALQELYRLRKEADTEKRRRERSNGKQALPGRAPIEKDW